MYQTTVKIDGMVCGMCESHINDAIRRAFPVKRVSSSRTRGKTVILTESEISEDALREVINGTGYQAVSVRTEAYEKKGLFGFLR